MNNNRPEESITRNTGSQTLNSGNSFNSGSQTNNERGRNFETTPRYNQEQGFDRRPSPSNNNNDWSQPVTTKRSTYFQGDLPFLHGETTVRLNYC